MFESGNGSPCDIKGDPPEFRGILLYPTGFGVQQWHRLLDAEYGMQALIEQHRAR
jgi:hypothetical protein